MRIERAPVLAACIGLVLLALAITAYRYYSGPDEGRPPGQYFVSRPDLSAPKIKIIDYNTPTGRSATAAQDPVFIAPKEGEPMTGPVILDADGDPIWIHPLHDEIRAFDFKVQKYQGKPVLTWFQGPDLALGYGQGKYVLMNESYQRIATVNTQGSLADHHGMTLTPDGTALMITYREIPYDLSDIGHGPKDGYLLNQVVQEVDVATGKVLFRWSALGHIPVDQTEIKVGPNVQIDGSEDNPLDFAHINSVTEDSDGDLLISGRNTSAVYKVDRQTGKVEWTLGGEASDFTMAGNSEFVWQHDVHRQPDGTITIFDNEAAPQVGPESRGLRLALDMKTMTARVVTQYLPPEERVAASQGSVQVRRNGDVFVGWGKEPYYSEYTGDGDLLFDARVIDAQSYRAHRQAWVGHPVDPPDIAVKNSTAYVSWNGSTQVTAWRFLAGDDAASAQPVGTVPRSGFETSSKVPDAPYIAAQALGDDGQVLSTAVD